MQQKRKIIIISYSLLLEPYGYKMEGREPEREIIDIKTNKVIKYDWSEVK